MSEKNPGKDVIYIDVDDEITGIIDKVRGSGQKIIALVLPKRATVLQSVVNMKLLRRAADESKKNIVLITSEAGLMPLAGSVGVHVAKNLQSKPEIPDGPARPDNKPDEVDEPDAAADEIPDEPALDKNRSVGELAGATAVEDTIELGDEDEETPEDDKNTAKGAGGKKTGGKDKKLKIPNFNRFRVFVILGAFGLIGLAVFAYMAIAVMPRATVTIKTDSEAITSSLAMTLKTGEGIGLDLKEGIVPAKSQQAQKTTTQQVDATGQQNNGAKATGTVTIRNCTDDPVTIPAGTGVTASGLVFITQDTLNLDSGNFSGGGVCKTTGGHTDATDVIAQLPGTKYNVTAQSYSVAGHGSTVTGTGTVMEGGTDDIIKIVTQADIDGATQKIGAQDTTGIKQQLKTDLTNLGFYPVEATFNPGNPTTKTSANAGDKADTVSVTQTITYTMLGVKQDDLEKVIANDIVEDIDPKKQSILDYGIDDALFSMQSSTADGAVIDIQTEVIAGPDLKIDDIKKAVAGHKANDAKELIKANPGVTEVSVTYKPFWVSSIPKNVKKITVTVEKPEAAQSGDDESDSGGGGATDSNEPATN